MLAGRIRRKEESFYGAEPALGEKLIRARYHGLGERPHLSGSTPQFQPARRAFEHRILFALYQGPLLHPIARLGSPA